MYISVGLLWWPGTSGLYGNQLYKPSKVSIFVVVKQYHFILKYLNFENKRINVLVCARS